MTSYELRNKFLEFFKSKNHKIISGYSLIPENDLSVLFTTAGMHPLKKYFLGEKCPFGNKIADVQKCLRTSDLDLVGDSDHLTFFEMLGNWSFGDYFKKDSIKWSLEFLTEILEFPKEQINVTVFAGENEIPKDNESFSIWKDLGIPEERIFFLPKENNWWELPGENTPCGPDTEMFIDLGIPPCGSNCHPGCNCGKYVEIWNNVFMQYKKTSNGKYESLKQNCVDTGMGLERTLQIINYLKSVYETDLFIPILNQIHNLSEYKNSEDKEVVRAERIIADHLRTAIFILGDPSQKVKPGNLKANYVLRRLIRKSIRQAKFLKLSSGYITKIAEVIIETYKNAYPELEQFKDVIFNELEKESKRFENTLRIGTREFNKVAHIMKRNNATLMSGYTAFKLFDTYGLPIEITEDLAKQNGFNVDKETYEVLLNWNHKNKRN